MVRCLIDARRDRRENTHTLEDNLEGESTENTTHGNKRSKNNQLAMDKLEMKWLTLAFTMHLNQKPRDKRHYSSNQEIAKTHRRTRGNSKYCRGISYHHGSCGDPDLKVEREPTPPGGFTPAWKVTAAINVAITSRTFRASLGESLSLSY
uniref:Uncharacterized protein n=1 Tax=Salix viminalis TaxID=40686 RepID=A0A6N2MSF3_SALVM